MIGAFYNAGTVAEKALFLAPASLHSLTDGVLAYLPCLNERNGLMWMGPGLTCISARSKGHRKVIQCSASDVRMRVTELAVKEIQNCCSTKVPLIADY